VYCTWDIETTTDTLFKRKGSPFAKSNWVVTHAFKHKDKAVEEHRFGKHPPGPGWLKPVLQGTRLLIGFNIKFDVLHAIQDEENLDAWMEYVAGGGNVWDCQLAEYLLNGMGQSEHMLSLDEVAPRYGGNVKFDEVKALWNAGVRTEDIEPELLSRYLVGGKDETGVWQEGDIGNTEKIALAQIKRARECGQLNSILLNMGSLLCTIEMERNGMYVDKALGLALAAELKVEVDRLRVELEKHLPQDLPFKFNWGSPAQKSALIFGGTVKYDAYEYDMAAGGTVLKSDYDAADVKPERLYAQRDELHYVMQDGSTQPVVEGEFAPDGAVRYAGGKNAGEAKTKKVKVDDLTKPKGRACKAPYTFPRMTAPKPEWAGSTPGQYSTGAEVIEALGNRGIPFLTALAELTAATKDLGTYFIVTDDETGESKGMLTLVDEHGVIHHSINHTSTVTGRFSSSNPNLQNIPKGNKSKIKLVFQSRFGGYWITDDYGDSVWIGGKLIQSDFTALEIYVQAVITKCKQLIKDLQAGLDMHVLRLSNSPAGEGKSYEELLILCKGDKKTGAAPVSEWDYKRTDAKVYSFQAAYGAGDTKISESTGISIEQVAAFRAADDKRYPEIKKYFEDRTVEIKQNRKPTGVVVPHPVLRGVMCSLGRSSVRTPDGKLYSYMEDPSPEYLAKKGITASFSPTQIKNYEVQGEGGEWAKAAMWLAVREFYKRKNFGQRALLVNQVHDALYADAASEVADEAAAVLHACMEAASEFMEYLFKWPVPVPVPSDTTYGANMKEENAVPGVREKAAVIRQQIRDTYMQGYVPSFTKKETP
jgi:DNA polymerase-1